MKKESITMNEHSLAPQWTIEDLKKKVEQDRLKFSKKQDHLNGSRTILRVHPENLKSKAAKGF